jgi:hypothetical protein
MMTARCTVISVAITTGMMNTWTMNSRSMKALEPGKLPSQINTASCPPTNGIDSTTP